MNIFERYLTLWVALCILAGVLLGQAFPSAFQAVSRLEVARVNLPVGALIWVMIIPMLVKVDFAALGEVRHHARKYNILRPNNGHQICNHMSSGHLIYCCKVRKTRCANF